MYLFREQNLYDQISTRMLGLLTNFSKLILTIEKTTDELLKNDKINKNPHFLQFISHFALGRYYHFRCQGYMECLVVTKCYTPASICYWLNKLVIPASQHFMEALNHFDKLKTTTDIMELNEFRRLVEEVNEFKKVSMKIMKETKLYNLHC